MAFDSLCSDGGTRMNVTKARRIKGDLVGIAGSLSSGIAFWDWYKAGADKESGDIPDPDLVALLLDSRGRLWCYESSLHKIRIEEPFYAIGSGHQAALAAMHRGATPAEAVRIAAKYDVNTGGRVRTLRLIPTKRKR